uniref:Uncharacterized protein LOC102803066 n=1 Tax=Saccoglossus kowalevskii TaxID=10224 RepID=A0ABM0ME99_SACKO|nr:PREDICTED: uncharacterized protein LOC102803066 [Saccoglossus kowalevskii]
MARESNSCFDTQFVFDKNRFIGDVRLENIMEYTWGRKISQVYLVTVDFDTIEWPIFKVLDFGPILRQWVKVFYLDISRCVMNKGASTGYFSLGRGVRQGDPIPPMLFILAVEIFLCSLRSGQHIEGTSVLSYDSIKSVSFADDLTCFLGDLPSSKKLQNSTNWKWFLSLAGSLESLLRTSSNFKLNVVPTKVNGFQTYLRNNIFLIKVYGFLVCISIFQYVDDLFSEEEQLLNWNKLRENLAIAF